MLFNEDEHSQSGKLSYIARRSWRDIKHDKVTPGPH